MSWAEWVEFVVILAVGIGFLIVIWLVITRRIE